MSEVTTSSTGAKPLADWEFAQFLLNYSAAALMTAAAQAEDEDVMNEVPDEDRFDYCQGALSDKARAIMTADCRAFVDANLADIREVEYELSLAQIAHDFWMVRSGSGVGYTDRGIERGTDEYAAAVRLSEAASKYRQDTLVVGYDGKLYQESN